MVGPFRSKLTLWNVSKYRIQNNTGFADLVATKPSRGPSDLLPARYSKQRVFVYGLEMKPSSVVERRHRFVAVNAVVHEARQEIWPP